jgi:hypothetical protein
MSPFEERPAWERELDALVRPSLVVDPPADVQRSILSAVLLAAAQAPRPTGFPSVVQPAPSAGRAVPLVAYLLLAALLVVYVATISWVESLFGNATWVTILVQQLLAASELVVGRPTTSEPLALVWQLLQRAPWLALVPVAWLLWERDRSSARVA